MELNNAQLEAYAAFLVSEIARHVEDIEMIDAKLEILRNLGVDVSE